MKKLIYYLNVPRTGESMIKKYVSQILDALDELEKMSEIPIDDEKKYYFSNKFTIFNNDLSTARTIEEKVYLLENITDLLDLMRDRVEEIELATEVAYCYLKNCGGDDE